MTTASVLLRSHEARGIVWSMSARILFCVAVIALSIRDALGLALFGSGVVFGALCIRWARRERHLTFIGLSGVGFDLVMMIMVASLLQRGFIDAGAQPGLLAKGPLTLVAVDLIAVNAMTLRPLYPAAVAAGALLIHIGTTWFAFGHTGTVVTSDSIQALSTAAVDRNAVAANFATIIIVGFFLTAMSLAARRLIENVVSLELRNQRVVEQQASMMMEFRMTGIANLVAGVAHELNTPLGASMSSADTVSSCADKLGASVANLDPKANRVLGLLRDSSRVVKDACARMTSVVQSLKSFSRLDEAEIQQTDIRAGMRSSLDLVTRDAKGDVRIVENYGDVPTLRCRPKELNQVFLSLLLHSFQTMKGDGTLSIDIFRDGDAIAVSIRDSSEGMSESTLRGLFDIGFEKKGARISMGLELPTAKLVVEQHQGTISVESEEGQGSRYLIRLPLAGSESELRPA